MKALQHYVKLCHSLDILQRLVKHLQLYIQLRQSGHPPGISKPYICMSNYASLEIFQVLVKPLKLYVKFCQPEHPPGFIENPSTLGQSLQAWESSSDLVTSLQLYFTLC